MQGVTRTLPLEVYLQREQDPDAALALALLLIIIALLVTAVTTAIEAQNGRRTEVSDAAEQPTAPVVVTRGATRRSVSSLRADVPERGVDYELTGRPGRRSH